MLKKFAYLAVGLGLIASQPALALNMKDIEKGKVDVTFVDPGEGLLKSVRAIGLIKAAPLKVWKVLVDYANYQAFMPKVAKSKVSKRLGNYAETMINLDLPWPMAGTWYLNGYREDSKNYTIRWSMIKGSIKHNEGSWQLRPYGANTLATYFVKVDPGLPLPKWMVDTATKSTVPSIFEAIRNRVR